MTILSIGGALCVVAGLTSLVWCAFNFGRRTPESDVLISVAVGVGSCGFAMVSVSLIIMAVTP